MQLRLQPYAPVLRMGLPKSSSPLNDFDYDCWCYMTWCARLVGSM
jgi:hypothetical protein